MNSKPSLAHGRRCTCQVLAAAVGLPPQVVNYRFCSQVLKKRWVIECDHGDFNRPTVRDTSGKWHDLEPMEPLMKAVLIHEE